VPLPGQSPQADDAVSALAGAGPGRVNLGAGNLLVILPAVGSGAFSASPSLTYNSVSAKAGEFGYGWTSLFNQQVTAIDAATANVTKGTGTVLLYTDKNGSGQYRAPGGVLNALVKNGDGTWTETQPNGMQLRYDTTGLLSGMQSVAGGRWTVSRDTGHRITKIADPVGAIKMAKIFFSVFQILSIWNCQNPNSGDN